MEIAVIGGGAAGLMAAIAAKKDNTTVTIYEKEKRIGRKILATGNGRCNMTNTMASEADYHGNDVSFMRYAIEHFWVDKTLDLFEKLGLLYKEEDGGKVYPYSDTASSVLDVLRRKVDTVGVKTVCEFSVKSIKKQNEKFVIESADGNKELCDKVIIATGGKAGSQLGSDDSGYALLKSFWHKITNV